MAHFPVFDLDTCRTSGGVDQWVQNFNADLAERHGSGTFGVVDHVRPHGRPADRELAEQADNDLAVGRIVDYDHATARFGAIRRFSSTEDDAQDGVDHVDGHRSPGYIVSPFVVQRTSLTDPHLLLAG